MSKKDITPTPPAFSGAESFMEAEKKFQNWKDTEEGRHYIELSRKQQEELKNAEKK